MGIDPSIVSLQNLLAMAQTSFTNQPLQWLITNPMIANHFWSFFPVSLTGDWNMLAHAVRDALIQRCDNIFDTRIGTRHVTVFLALGKRKFKGARIRIEFFQDRCRLSAYQKRKSTITYPDIPYSDHGIMDKIAEIIRGKRHL